MRTSNISL